MTASKFQFGDTPRAYILLIFTTLCWGCNAVFSRLAVGELSPLLLVTLRWTGVLILLLLIARKQFRKDWPVLKTKIWLILAMGTIGFTGFNALFYVAAHSTTAVNLGILQGSIPVFVLLGTFAVFKTPVTGAQILGVLVTLVGVIIVASGGSLERLASLAFNHGDLLMMIACLFYALYTIALRRKPQASALGFFTIMALAAFVTSLPLVTIEWLSGDLQMPTPKGWVVMAAIVILPSFLAQIAFINGVGLIGPGRAGIFVNLVPVFASILAVLFLNEPFEMFHAVSLAFVLGGIWLAERRKKA
ncbi:DMT family transporter [Sneathiella chinensis]|uniref:Membrane protein n=1 Tax=Sneathiella chinensis TaxID=349750 RepID=A0ABQ5U3F8_9PROT|nr:DMT family transporter [Sneathiella chinensis]GLQ05036.1 membrane protein [Sneathiella chinensis]